MTESKKAAFMSSMDVINQLDQSTESVTVFVKKLRSLSISTLAEVEKQEYLDIVGQYEDILYTMLKYISDEKPKFEYLQGVVRQNNLEAYKLLCNNIDLTTPIDIIDAINKLQKSVKDRKQKIGSKRRDKMLRLVVMGGAGVCLVIASIATAVITLASVGAAVPLIVPIVASGFAVFSGLGGFKLLYDLIQDKVEHAKLVIIDDSLASLDGHLKEVQVKCRELKMSNSQFEMDVLNADNGGFDVDDTHDHNAVANHYIDKKSDIAEHLCHLCRLKIICRRLTMMEHHILHGAK